VKDVFFECFFTQLIVLMIVLTNVGDILMLLWTFLASPVSYSLWNPLQVVMSFNFMTVMVENGRYLRLQKIHLFWAAAPIGEKVL